MNYKQTSNIEELVLVIRMRITVMAILALFWVSVWVPGISKACFRRPFLHACSQAQVPGPQSAEIFWGPKGCNLLQQRTKNIIS